MGKKPHKVKVTKHGHYENGDVLSLKEGLMCPECYSFGDDLSYITKYTETKNEFRRAKYAYLECKCKQCGCEFSTNKKCVRLSLTKRGRELVLVGLVFLMFFFILGMLAINCIIGAGICMFVMICLILYLGMISEG